MQLMSISQPRKRYRSDILLMPAEDVFSISGRGTVVTGRIELGTIKVGETIEIVGFSEILENNYSYWCWDVQKKRWIKVKLVITVGIL